MDRERDRNAAHCSLLRRSFARRDVESATDPSRGIKLHDLQLDYVRARYPDRGSLKLIHEATRLSAHVIESDPQQFASQMIGRLLQYHDSPGIQNVLSEIG